MLARVSFHIMVTALGLDWIISQVQERLEGEEVN